MTYAHATLMALDLPELRRMLAAQKAARPGNPFSPGMAGWMKDKDALTFAIERKEGEMASPPFHITVSPQPMEGLKVQPELAFYRMTGRRHTSPESEPHEEPMPKPEPTVPQARLTQLLSRLKHNDETKNIGAAYVTRGDIRKHCAARPSTSCPNWRI